MSAAKLLLRLGKKALWNPMDLGPNVSTAWWNPDLHGNTAYMTDDGSGLISSYSAMVSKGTMTGATTARPTWDAAAWGQNSKAGLTFDGVANVLNVNSTTNLPTGSTAGEMWLLFKIAIVTGGTRMVFNYGGTTGGTCRAIGYNNGVIRASDLTTNLIDATTYPINSYLIVGAFWSGTTMGLRINGADASPATATIGSLNSGTTRTRMGEAITSVIWHNGVVRHAIVTTLLTAAQRLLMEGFLAWDGWSSAATNPLPTTHPYKYRAP